MIATAEDSDDPNKVLERALDDLPDGDRQLIVLRNYGGASWEAVAQETKHASPDAARVAYQRAIAALARLLRERLGDGS